MSSNIPEKTSLSFKDLLVVARIALMDGNPLGEQILAVLRQMPGNESSRKKFQDFWTYYDILEPIPIQPTPIEALKLLLAWLHVFEGKTDIYFHSNESNGTFLARLLVRDKSQRLVYYAHAQDIRNGDSLKPIAFLRINPKSSAELHSALYTVPTACADFQEGIRIRLDNFTSKLRCYSPVPVNATVINLDAVEKERFQDLGKVQLQSRGLFRRDVILKTEQYFSLMATEGKRRFIILTMTPFPEQRIAFRVPDFLHPDKQYPVYRPMHSVSNAKHWIALENKLVEAILREFPTLPLLDNWIERWDAVDSCSDEN